jgi:hypothetical protein
LFDEQSKELNMIFSSPVVVISIMLDVRYHINIEDLESSKYQQKVNHNIITKIWTYFFD